MRININNIIPFSEARNKLSQLVDQLASNTYFVISKQNKQKAVLVDLSYFSYLVEKVEKEDIKKIENSLQDNFLAYAKKKLKKNNITDEDAYQLVAGKNLTW